jgi:putative peptidoglycan lipid II flippase
MNSSHRQIARAAGIVMAAFVVSRLFGVARDMVIAAQLGTSDAADAYLAAFRIPDLIFALVAGGRWPAFILRRFLARDDCQAPGVWFGVINLLLVVASVAAALAALLAPAIVRA